MSVEYEAGRKNLQALAEWYADRAGDRNEATTRLHLIDRLVFDCLGWSREDVRAEEPRGREYADYTFSYPRRVLILEAKREGNYFELPTGTNRLEYSIPSLMRDYPSLKDAMQQATGYCQSRGVLFGAVSNGHQIVAFVATRVDGLPPLEGKALVFPSLEFMSEHFLEVWQTLSKSGIEQKNLQHRLVGGVHPQPPAKLSAALIDYPGVRGRNEFQADLQVVSELVIEDIVRSRELEARFLQECYAPSGALSQYALISKGILEARYAALTDASTPGPTTTPAMDRQGVSPELLVENISRRPILLIGDVGVGKTTFIRWLIAIEAAQVFQDAIALYINFGTQATLTDQVHEFVLDEIGRQLREEHGVDIEAGDFVRGVYNADLNRFARGIYGCLKETNPATYQEKELALLESKLQNKQDHLKHALQHLTAQRRKQIVIFLDNADQRSDSIQQQTFLMAQEFAAHWPATVFVALRPETFYRSTKVGALSGYHAKAFTIAPPRVDVVIKKRLNFALKLTGGEIPIQALTETTLVRLRSLDGIIRVFLHSLDCNLSLMEFIDNVSAGNIRLALDLIRNFFGSGHVDTGKIVDIYEREGRYNVPLHEFLRAVIYGDTRHYDPERSPIANIFAVSSPDTKEHFLLPLIIGFLALAKDATAEGGFIDTTRVYERIQGLGFTPDQIDTAILRGYRYKLVETSARRIPERGQAMPEALRATTVGVYHISKLARMFTYVDAMVVDTSIVDPDARSQIRDAQSIGSRLDRAIRFCEYLDSQWVGLLQERDVLDWFGISRDLKIDIDNIRSRTSSSA